MMSAKRSSPSAQSPSPQVSSSSPDGSRPHTSGPRRARTAANRAENESAIFPQALTSRARTAAGRGGEPGLDLGAVGVRVPDRDLGKALHPALAGLQFLGGT